MIPNLNSGDFRKLVKLVSSLVHANPLASSSLGRGRIRLYDGSVLLIENGALQVTGTASISGVLNVSGQTNLSGQVSVTGPMNITGTTTIGGNTSITGELVVTGPTTLDGVLDIGGDTTITGMLDVTGDTSIRGLLSIEGNTEISGNLDITGDSTISGTLGIEGVTTLQNDLILESGGKIRAGNLEIEPANGGQINFSGGALSSGLGGLLLNHSSRLELFAPSIALTGTVSFSSVGNAPTGAEPNVYLDSNGVLRRIP